MAQQDSEAQFIDVNELRIGMFVYLDLGWMRHPFALNSFKITAQDQIDTILTLGINRIRWSPEKSDLEPPPATESAPAPALAPAPATGTAAPVAGDAQAGTPTAAPAVAEDEDAAAAAETPEVDADATPSRQAMIEAVAAEAEKVRQRRERLNIQRESLEFCEKQFASAARAYRQVVDQVQSQPDAARGQTEQLVGGMVDKLLEQEESAIRLLSENAGEKASLHALNVTVIALLLGKAMALDAFTLNQIGIGALLHDIGKIRLPERLRWRDTQFSNAERHLYEDHVAQGIVLAQGMKLSPGALSVIAQHHELADGSGFPRSVNGDRIAVPARIVALVNHYDNLCNPSNPALAITPHEALSQIFALMKKKFDPHVLTLFIRMMGVYPPGSVVELTDGRYALVVSVNSTRPLKPQIIIFEPRVPRNDAVVEDLEQAPHIGIRRSLKPLQLPRAAFDYLSPRQRICYFFERARSSQDEGGNAS